MPGACSRIAGHIGARRTIEKVGPHLEVPSGAHEINLRKATVLPGFIDVHTHLTSGREERDTADWEFPRHGTR